MSNNNNSVLVLGLAAILLVAGLAGAAVFAIGSSNNSVVDYAPENSFELRAYASEISSTNSTDADEITLYSSLMNKVFVSDSNRICTITSVEFFDDYLSSLGYYADIYNSRYSISSHEMSYGEPAAVASAVRNENVQLYFENQFMFEAASEVLKTTLVKDFADKSCTTVKPEVLKTTLVKDFADVYVVNPDMLEIETITASTFANLSSVMTMPFEANSISDLIVILSDVDGETQLSDKIIDAPGHRDFVKNFFDGDLYHELSSLSANSKHADADMGAIEMVTVKHPDIYCASELQYYLRTVDSTAVDWFGLNIEFNAPLDTSVAGQIFYAEMPCMVAAGTHTLADSTSISTIGHLLDRLTSFDSIKVNEAC